MLRRGERLLRHAFDGLLELPDDQLQPVDKLPLLEGPYCGTYLSAERAESAGMNYVVKLLDASKLVAGGSIEVEWTNIMFPDRSTSSAIYTRGKEYRTTRRRRFVVPTPAPGGP